jgi:hypothetical protein
MASFNFIDRYYEKVYARNRDKFLAKFPYRVTINVEAAEMWKTQINTWLRENIGRLNNDYRIQYDRTTKIYCFKKQEDSITFALRWM